VRVEFLRQSDSGLITLVLHPSGTDIRSHWALLSVNAIADGIEVLREREGTPKVSAIGHWSVGESAPEMIADLADWADSRGINHVVWTALPPKFHGEAERVPSAQDIVGHLKSCAGDIRARAEEYIRRAPRATQTRYRQIIESELGWTPPDVQAELATLRNFTLFLDRQLGVYCDCLTGFGGNKARVELEIPRAQRPAGRTIKDGRPVIVWASVEDPESPDVIHHRIIRAAEFLATNSEAGFNEQQVCWAIVAFVFSYWNEEIRPRVAAARGAKSEDIKVSVFGDLRILRHSILHRNGLLPAAEHRKLLVLGSLCQPDSEIVFTHQQMKKLFELMHQGVAQLAFYHSGHLAGAPPSEDILKVAIQNVHGGQGPAGVAV
jgi:hypothetical protein